jgi:hypothetical protein
MDSTSKTNSRNFFTTLHFFAIFYSNDLTVVRAFQEAPRNLTLPLELTSPSAIAMSPIKSSRPIVGVPKRVLISEGIAPIINNNAITKIMAFRRIGSCVSIHREPCCKKRFQQRLIPNLVLYRNLSRQLAHQ